MGAWGPGLFSDDTACDVREDYKDLLGEGMEGPAATDRLLAEWRSAVDDPDEGPVFWLALAATQWKLGRLEDRVQTAALQAIESGADLLRWTEPKERRKREQVLAKLRDLLATPQPQPRRVRRREKETTDWELGEIIAYRLSSGRQILFRVIGYQEDKGGRYAVVELLDWVGTNLPDESELATIPVRYGPPFSLGEGLPTVRSECLIIIPTKAMPADRVRRTGMVSRMSRRERFPSIVHWQKLDKKLEQTFDLR